MIHENTINNKYTENTIMKNNNDSGKQNNNTKIGNIATMYLKLKYHPALAHMEMVLRNGGRNILYSNPLKQRMFPHFLVSWLKGESIRLLLKPSYNNKSDNSDDDNDNDRIRCCPCNEKNCKHCKFVVQTRFIQFNEYGRSFKIDGSFDCRTNVCVYAVKTPITELWYITSTQDFKKRKRNAKSNLKCFNPEKPRGCGLIVHLYRLSIILNIM